MVFNVDTSYGGDHAFVPNVETVTFDVRDETGASTASVATAKGKRLDIRNAQQAFGAAASITTKDTTWRIWNSTLGSNIPEIGDTITDSGSVIYVITDVTKQRPGPTWLFNTRARK